MASGASGMKLPATALRQTHKHVDIVLVRAESGYGAPMNIGRIVREVEALPDTEEEPLPLSEPAPEPVPEPARLPV